MSGVDQYHRAALAWTVLTGLAKQNKSEITYGELGASIGIHHRAVRFVLGVLLDYCEESELPPLTVLVVNKTSRQPGAGFISWYGDFVEQAREAVLLYKWSSMRNPFSEIVGLGTPKAVIKAILSDPTGSKETLKQVPGRGYAQSLFREALLVGYDCKCCVCGVGYTDALQASHIIPWNVANWIERSSPNNGLLLCANHHSLFDRSRLGISVSGKISIDRLSGDIDHRSGHGILTNYEDKMIRLPESKDLHPSNEFLARRYEMDGW